MTCLAKNNLKKYLNPVFIETGTFLGDGVCMAKDSGFGRIISIEVSKLLCEKASLRFKEENITIVNGDSSKILWSVIKDIKERITFVLDAHNLCYGEDTLKDNKNLEWWPLMKELEIITKHSRRDHTIIVDDVRLFELFGTSITWVKNILLKINPIYQFCFIDGITNEKVILKDNILIADVQE